MNKQGLVLGWLAVTLLVLLVGLAVRNETPFSQYQPLYQMQAEYTACKQNAPEGFDCYMQPVLVSVPFIVEQSKQ